MKLVLILALGSIITIQSCNAQSQAKATEIYNEKFKWTITIPESFENVPPAQ